MKILSLITIFFLFSGCTGYSDSKSTSNASTLDSSSTLKKKEAVDSIIPTKGTEFNTELTIPKRTVRKAREVKEPQIRFGEGVSDEKLNGSPILIQLELNEKQIANSNDTIRQILRNHYLSMESQFPRSIADNFEAGISAEHISYPRLVFSVELFEDEYAKKPYRIQNFMICKGKDGQIIVE